jgi:D-amino-acid dehydrogenase
MSRHSVAVVGGGVAGAATAFALARAGAAVTVIEGGLPGQATAAGAGIIQPWSSSVDGAVYDFYAAGAGYYPTLLEALAEAGVTDVGYRVGGSLVVSPDPAELDAVEERVRRRITGVPVAGALTRIDGRQARTLFPPLAPELQALHVSGGARVDGRRLRDGLLEAARRLGTVIVQGAARLHVGAGGSCEVHTPTGPVAADAVIVASGAWTDHVLRPLGFQLGVEPQRGQICHLLLDGVNTSAWPSVLPLGAHYIVAFDGGRIVAGATRETGSGFDARVTAAGGQELLGNALSVAPGLAEATLLEIRVGLRPLADRQSPVIGAVPGYPALFVNTGLGAAGLTMAPLAGAALAQLVLGGSPDVDLRAFAPTEPARGQGSSTVTR